MEGGGRRTAAAPRRPRISSWPCTSLRRRRRTNGRVSWPDIPVEARPWGDVPDNIVVTIYGFLSCRADRVHMACVNKHWHASVMELHRPPLPLLPPLPPLPPQLPWLIFPSTSPPTFYSVLGDRYHRLHWLPADVEAARCRGSGDGGWLFLALPAPQAYVLYNLNSGRRIWLPSLCHTIRHANDNAATAMPLDVLSATLSASPSRGPYVVAAIGIVTNSPAAAFWHEGCATWFGVLLTVTPQDVIYLAHEGGFLFLMPDEKLLLFRPTPRPNGGMHLGFWFWDVQQRATYRTDNLNVQEVAVMKRYLVDSPNGLLMVVRFVFNEQLRLRTYFIRVLGLELHKEEAVPGGGQRRRIWQEINDLDGWMLFLGVGCSRSFEVALYDGFRASMAYFLDESFFNVPAVDDHGEAAANIDDPGSVYDDVTDTGRFSIYNFFAEPWPPRGPGLKPRSDVAPVWWLQ